MSVSERKISDIINTDGRDYTGYVIGGRAIASLVDGLKPSQRFVLCSAIKNAPTVKHKSKIVTVGGYISELGYMHGETSGFAAAALMANTWSNNYPILDGYGNFGSRVVNEAAQPRYIFCNLSERFHHVFKDNDLLPKHEIHSYKIPKYYLPIIPFVLVNGSVGIASGYSSKILPHDIVSVTQSCIDYLKTGKNKSPELKFPQFFGNVETSGDEWFIEGVYELQSKTKMVIKEIPLRYDREKYVNHLRNLKSKDVIVNFDEIDGESLFNFRITLKRDFDTSHENIIKTFGLREPISQNLVLIGPNNDMVKSILDVRTYDDTASIVRDFVDFRIGYIEKRIEKRISEIMEKIPELTAKIKFIKLVNKGEIKFKGFTKKQLIEQVSERFDDDQKRFAGDVVNMPMHSMTDEEIEKMEAEHNRLLQDLDYWKNTTAKDEYIKDLKQLMKTLRG